MISIGQRATPSVVAAPPSQRPRPLSLSPPPPSPPGAGSCDGATVELALNYAAHLHANDDAGGLYTLADVPYTSNGHADCAALTEGKTPTASVEGWTRLPTNDYRAVMNALAKVRAPPRGGHVLPPPSRPRDRPPRLNLNLNVVVPRPRPRRSDPWPSPSAPTGGGGTRAASSPGGGPR